MMKSLFRGLTALLLVCVLCTAGILSAFAEEAEPAATPAPTPTPMPTAEPRLTPGPEDCVITEADGGEFRPLDLDLTKGGAPVKARYSYEMKIYQDPTIRVERHRVRSPEWNCTYYYAYIEIKDPSQIRTAAADDAFRTTRLAPVNLIGKHKNAVLAINGDYFAAFSGNKANNYVLRQGELRRDTVAPELDMLLIDEDGDFHVLTADTDLAAAEKTQINGKKVINAFQFGPALVIDGEKVADEKILDRGHAPNYVEADRRAQRMCIAQIDTLHYMVLCCAHYGMDLIALRDLAMTLADCKVVYNLDGGASTQMAFLNKQVNNTTSEEGPRDITDIIYFASAWFRD